MTKITMLKAALNFRFIRNIILTLAILLMNMAATPARTPILQQTEKQRYLSFNIWGWRGELSELAQFQKIVDVAKSKGFNTISLAFGWSFIESSPNDFQFDWLDQRVDYIVEQGLKVQLRVSYSRAPAWVDDSYFMKNEYGRTVVWYETIKQLVIADAQVRTWMERALVETVKRYQNRYASKPVIFYTIPMTWDEETDYAFGGEGYLDHSQQAQEDFRQWLQNKYAAISDLNQRWGASYAAFSEVMAPKFKQYGANTWADWMNYRAFALKRLFDQLADALHSADADAEIGLQFATITYEISGIKGTYDAAKLVESADWVIVDDTPWWNHKFSMDLLRTIVKGKRIGNEIGGHAGYVLHGNKTGVDPADLVLKHGLETFTYGGDILNFANWDSDTNVDTGVKYDSIFVALPQWAPAIDSLAIEATNPVSVIEEPQTALYVSTMMQYLFPICECPGKWGDMFLGVQTYDRVSETYQLLTHSETEPAAVITDNVFTGDPSVLNQFPDGIYLPSFNKIISDSAYAALSQAGVPLYAEDSGVGTKNEYGENRTPAIFSPYPPATGVSSPQTIIPEKFELLQNYPNPFNPTTTIKFSIPNRSYVTLKVFDVLGREAATLVDGELNPGAHSVVFDARGLANGVYFYQLKSAGFTKLRKLVLLQ